MLSLPFLCRLQLCDIRLLELVPQLADVLVFCSDFFPLCFILDTFCCYIFKFTNLLSCDICGCCLVAKLCLTLCDPRDCSLPGSSVHGISQARILEWVAISFSRYLPEPGIEPVSFALAGGFFTTSPLGCLLLIPCSVFFIFRDGVESFLYHPCLYTVA